MERFPRGNIEWLGITNLVDAAGRVTVIDTGKPPVFPPSVKPCPKGTLGFPERDFPAEGTDESSAEPPLQAEPGETESGGGPPP